MNSDERFIQRCFDLAQRGIGSVSPNPLVGCVVVHHNEIIGEGWHQKYGDAHAEVNAINSVSDKNLLSSATVYVNLEPCSHFGKTPPCADMLVRHNVKKVVISNFDSNPLVSGKGIEKLKAAGIEVVTNVLEKEGRLLNRRFFTFVEQKRPYVILKWAQTSDGFIGHNNHTHTSISNELSQQLLHKWRSEENAFLVGTRTAAADNPKLNVRYWSGRNPIRIVIDRKLRLDLKLHLFDGTQPTICYNTSKDEQRNNLDFVKIAGVNLVDEILEDLYKRKVQSLVIEGGTETLQHFIAQGAWDEARVFQSGKSFGAGVAAPKLNGTLVSEEVLAEDRVVVYRRV